MKIRRKVYVLAIVSITCFFSDCYSQEEGKKSILTRFISMHNDGRTEVIENFIVDTYSSELYRRLDVNLQVAFYRSIISDFGPLNIESYKTIESTSSKLIVHLIKEDDSILNEKIDPADILVVELDFTTDSPARLSRGLGLGALICTVRVE